MVSRSMSKLMFLISSSFCVDGFIVSFGVDKNKKGWERRGLAGIPIPRERCGQNASKLTFPSYSSSRKQPLQSAESSSITCSVQAFDQ